MAGVWALLLVFSSGVFIPYSSGVAHDFVGYMTGNVVGVGASVEPNELNVITAALTSRETELDRREAALTQREIGSPVDRSVPEQQSYIAYINAAILFILLLLIILNYTLDYMRARQLPLAPSR